MLTDKGLHGTQCNASMGGSEMVCSADCSQMRILKHASWLDNEGWRGGETHRLRGHRVVRGGRQPSGSLGIYCWHGTLLAHQMRVP